MTRNSSNPIARAYSSSEFLDYVEKLNGKQVFAYKKLAQGIARSSYSIQYYPVSQRFDVFASICNDWEEMSRDEFVSWHGDDERIWQIEHIPN